MIGECFINSHSRQYRVRSPAIMHLNMYSVSCRKRFDCPEHLRINNNLISPLILVQLSKNLHDTWMEKITHQNIPKTKNINHLKEVFPFDFWFKFNLSYWKLCSGLICVRLLNRIYARLSIIFNECSFEVGLWEDPSLTNILIEGTQRIKDWCTCPFRKCAAIESDLEYQLLFINWNCTCLNTLWTCFRKVIGIHVEI